MSWVFISGDFTTKPSPPHLEVPEATRLLELYPSPTEEYIPAPLNENFTIRFYILSGVESIPHGKWGIQRADKHFSSAFWGVFRAVK